jgi:uroporphyrin-3 C-methyltransferase
MSETETSEQAPNSKQDTSDNATQEASAVTQSPASSTNQPRKGGATLLLSAGLILTLAGGGAAGYLGWQQLQAQQSQLAALQQQTNTAQQSQSALQQQTQQLTAKIQQQTSSGDELQTVLAATQERLNGLGKRVNNLASTSREDWLLAEAEYLLRLGNQRLLMERQPQGAIALLEAADEILRDIDDMNLFSVRKALAQDLATLKLAPSIDRTGLYLELAAFSQQVEALAFVEIDRGEKTLEVQQTEQVVAAPEPEIWQQRLMASFHRALASLSRHIAIQTHTEGPAPLLSIEEQVYVKQNLRLMFEQAQLALLREEQKVYQHSLQQAASWLQNYFQFNPQVASLAEQIERLGATNIEQQLPNISGSLDSLQAFMADLHRLKPRDQKNPTVLEAQPTEAVPQNAQESK